MVVFKLKNLLEKNKMSRYRLEQITNWNNKRVKALYKGTVKVVSIKEIETICSLFNCNLTDFIEYKKDD